MGEVYLARDPRLNRNVALKIIAPGSTDDATRRRRFTAEARAASSLNHPNIITVHDFGSVDGISYIVSELVDGESLRAMLQRGPVPIRKQLEVAAQIADGLAAAHEAGIVHRDLKPENVMVTRTGRVKILDFGLAKPVLSPAEPDDANRPTFDGSPTEPGLILGTVGYMSPEQARGEAVSFQSDQFSVGVMLHELATGIAAFKRETPMQTLLAIANVDRVPFTPGPVALRLLVEKCLAKDPGQRFSSTAILRDKLRKILDDLPKPLADLKEVEIESQAESQAERGLESSWAGESAPQNVLPEPSRESPQESVTAKVSHSRRGAVALLAGLLVFGLGLLVARLIPRPTAAAATDYHFTALTPEDAEAVFPALSPSGKTVAFAKPVDGVFQIFTETGPAGSAAARTAAKQDCFFPFWAPDATRIFYVSGGDLWAVNETGGSPVRIAGNVVEADIAPDGQKFALVRKEPGGGQSVWTMKSGEEPRRVEQVPVFRRGLAHFSPEGDELGLWAAPLDGPSELWTVRLPRGEAHRTLAGMAPAGVMLGFNYFHDRRQIIYGGEHLWTAEVEAGKPAQITSGIGHEAWPSMSRDGKQAVFSSAAASYALHARPNTINVPQGGISSNRSPVWRPGHSEFAYVSERGGGPEIWLRDARSGWERVVVKQADFAEPTAALSDVAFSANGNSIAYTRLTREHESVWISNVDGERAVRVSEAGWSPTWSPDGNWLAFLEVENGQYTLAKVKMGSGEKPVAIKTAPGGNPQWSPDGSWILMRAEDGKLLLISVDGARSKQVGNSAWLAATWSQAGARIAGLRETTAKGLELVSMDASGSGEKVEADLGPAPASLAYAVSVGLPAVSGFSVGSIDGHALLYAIPQLRSGVWRVTGFGR